MTPARLLAALFTMTVALPLIAAGPRPQPLAPAPPAAAPASIDLAARVLARADSADAAPTAAPSAAAPSPTPAPAMSPAPTPAPAMSAAARAEFEAWQSGKIDLTHYIPEAKAQFTDSAVSQISAQYLHPLGAVKTFGYVRQMTVQGMTVYVYLATCANGSLEELISWNADGKVQFIFFRPPA
jgi:hypothetical protein